MILDNYATHKHPNVMRWLDRHPRFAFRDFIFVSDIVQFLVSSMDLIAREPQAIVMNAWYGPQRFNRNGRA